MENPFKNLPQTGSRRIPSIDQFRGFAILLMALANYMGGVSIIPPWLKHAPDIGLTIIDLIAPFFIFAISLTYGISYRRRVERSGAFQAANQFFTRYMAITGLGALISAVETAVNPNSSGIDWGVLQAIGTAGLLTLAVIRLRPVARLAVGLTGLAVYQVVLDRFLLDLTMRSPHGGIFGSLAWGVMMILGTVLADVFHGSERSRRLFPLASLVALAGGLLLAVLFPISKHRVSSSYVLVTLGASALLFWVFQVLSNRFHWKGYFLVVWGKNPLVLYFLHYLIIGLFVVPGIPVLYSQATPGVALAEIVVLIGGLTLAACFLDRRGWVFTL